MRPEGRSYEKLLENCNDVFSKTNEDEFIAFVPSDWTSGTSRYSMNRMPLHSVYNSDTIIRKITDRGDNIRRNGRS